MNVRRQYGHLRSVKRKAGPSAWEYLWRETDQSGKRVRRNVVIGTLEEYPTEELAQAAVNGLRMCINEDRNRQLQQAVYISDVIDHYLETELSKQTDWHSHATRIVYRAYLNRWVRPRWGSTNIRDVRTIDVESWLRQLQRQDGEALANSTKTKIRNLMSVLLNHAIRYEWLEQGKNSIKLVRQRTLRKRIPTVLEPPEIANLLSELGSFHRLMVLLAVTTGLRRSELFALKWSDVDFSNLTIDIRRSIYQGRVGNCKTAPSRRPVPVSLSVAADLWLWKETTRYAGPDDWIFASPRAKGRKPFYPDMVMVKQIRPASLRAGITRTIGWHTFRHTYSTILIANGENVKVVQELMRHSNSRTTLEVYSQARIRAKREAQQRLLELIIPDETQIMMKRTGPDESLGVT